MISVTHLAQHLLQLDPQKNVARLALYHYLKNCCDINGDLSASLIDQFYRKALVFQYWQTHQKTLGETLRNDLSSFLRDTQAPLDLERIRHADELQVVQLEQARDVQGLIEAELQNEIRPGDRLKLVRLSTQQTMSLKLNPSGCLKVRVHPHFALISNGRLELLPALSQLEYNSQMELLPQAKHWLDTSMLTTAQFYLREGGVEGLLIRGYTFQKFETLRQSSISQHPELFYSLKRLERHYINPKSDPFYQELVALLERAYQLVSSGHPDGPNLAQEALRRGKLALKNIFPSDKLLLLLVTNIEYWMLTSDKGQPWQQIKPLDP